MERDKDKEIEVLKHQLEILRKDNEKLRFANERLRGTYKRHFNEGFEYKEAIKTFNQAK